ncbi:AMP-binding protein [Streptomyces sp. NBC_00554]|uniref:fatty acyl-AMP ligase n=1 Tax=Streptomyces sp. NBC_00554 TaxID=2903661 RepID=UPI00352FCF51|nr:AMP-binding protein [Streptomyces sp. NBC_00554]
MPAHPLTDADPFPGTLPALLEHWAAATPARRAFTFVDHPTYDSRGVHRTLTWRRLDLRTRAVAARIARSTAPGDRVALLCPQGPDFVIGFLAALAAGRVAVPMFTPDLPGHGDRLAAVLGDARPSAVLTTRDSLDTVRTFLDDQQILTTLLATDLVPDSEAEGWQPPEVAERSTAYLQYTSGSTRVPAGVEISHANVVANARQALTAYGADEHPVTTVGWLPLYHDMGLVLSVAAPVVRGLLSVLMDPADFLQRPARWLRLLADHPGAISAAPNFAYDYCASAIGEEEKAGLRLDGVTALINGSEPVRPATAERFHAAFAAQGLPAGVHCPSYGLAEATVFVCAARPGDPVRSFALDREALAAGKALPVPPGNPGAVHLAGCGAPAGQRVRIADPATRTALGEGEVGEIWVQGPNIGRGYWNRGPQTRRVFHAALHGASGDWLRTGDLGMTLDGQLLVTGRLKDLVIVDGRNHYPQDLEATAQAAHPAIRSDRLAAFAVILADGTEGAVVVAEHGRAVAAPDRDPAEVGRAVRAALSARHGLRLADLALVPPGTIPRTSSGKVSRSLTRTRYLDGEYAAPEPGEAGTVTRTPGPSGEQALSRSSRHTVTAPGPHASAGATPGAPTVTRPMSGAVPGGIAAWPASDAPEDRGPGGAPGAPHRSVPAAGGGAP